VESSFELGTEPSGSIKSWKTITWPNNWLPLRVVLSFIELVSYGGIYRACKGNLTFY
jgi:hypothetical protein